MKPTVRAAALAFALAATALAPAAQAAPIAPAKIDEVANRALKAFQVPGMAVGVVKDGKLIFARGYGVRALGRPGAVDPDTLFQIGSNTKAFTAALLAQLVDEGKIRWDDKVIDYLPEFRLADPYVTREFTIRDLLTHRSGLGLGAGDLMFYPTTDFTRAEVIRGLRYLKPVTGFRSEFAYDNTLYMVAGELAHRVTGQPWEDMVKARILDPLGMTGCAASYDRITDRSDVASPHAIVEGRLTEIPVESIDVVGPAGTINCSVNGMARWMQTQLAGGTAPDGRQLFSAARGEEMWSPNTIEPSSPAFSALTGTHLAAYGLGWEIKDSFGYRRVGHTGGVPGTVTWVTMIPELKLGVVVLTNQQDGFAMEAVGNQILDSYLGAPRRDMVALLKGIEDGRTAQARAVEAQAAKTAAAAAPPPLPLDAYAGRFNDAWRGDATVRREGDKLVLSISRTKELEGTLSPYNGNVFIVRWKARLLDADAYVRFSQGFDGKVDGMTMRAISPATDFSFDFQDLDFKRVDDAK